MELEIERLNRLLAEKDQEMHQQRLRNAEQRNAIGKLQRQLEIKTKEQDQTKAENITLLMYRERDLKLFQRQEVQNLQQK